MKRSVFSLFLLPSVACLMLAPVAVTQGRATGEKALAKPVIQRPASSRIRNSLRSAWRRAALRYTVLRPAGFMENLLPLIRWVRRMGWAVIPAPGTTKNSYIAIGDVAEMARRVLLKAPANPVLEFGGEDLSTLDCVALLQEVLRRRVQVLRVPLGLLRVVGLVARPFTRRPDALLEIVEFVERRGLRADKKFLWEYPISLTSFRDFLVQQLADGGRQSGSQ